MHRRPAFAPARSASRPRPLPFTPSALLLAAVLSMPIESAAQVVRGRLAGEDNGLPVPGALVTLVDADGAAVRSAVSDAAGRYRLTAPAAGWFALRVERIGHRTVLTGRFELAAGQTRDLPLALPTEAITLEGIRARGTPRCATRPQQQDGLALQRVWDEARKALALTLSTAADSLLAYEFATFERVYTPGGRRLVKESTATRSSLTSRPFHSAPVEELAEHGFVQARDGGLVFFAPDAEVLLSDLFLERHCFGLREGSGETAGMIGLAFEPVRGRRRTDVRGVLWVDRRTSELRHLEFGFVGVHAARGAPPAEGRVEFMRTATGAWITRTWLLRFPVADLQLATDLHTNYRLGQARAIKEVGGTVVHELPADSAAAPQAVGGVLTAQDGGLPVSGALVTLVDAGGAAVRTAVSDPAGRYRLAAPAAGSYALRVERIGRRTVLTGRFELAAGQALGLPLALPPDAVTLEGIRAGAAGGCATGPQWRDAPALRRVWHEARKALALTLATAADSLLAYDFVTFERVYAPRERRLVSETTARRRLVAGRPFESAPVEELAEHGFVQAREGSLVFFAPDAEVLLSDLFLERHCFRLQEGEGETAQMIGLAFEPLRGRRRPDVRGVLWLDRGTAELRHLEFGFVGVYATAAASPGGRLEFMRTAGGAWIVRSWLLRFPVAKVHLAGDLHTNYRLGSPTAVKEVGGAVEAVPAAGPGAAEQ